MGKLKERRLGQPPSVRLDGWEAVIPCVRAIIFPFTIDQLTGASHARICSKISVEPEQGTAIRSAPKPVRICPNAFSCRNARAGFTVTIRKISSGETRGKFF